MSSKLTPKMDLFCREYLIDLNATQAAIRAGYSEKTARQVGSENLSKPDIQARIEELNKERLEKVEIDAQWVLRRAVEINNRCMQAEPVIVGGESTGEYKFDSSGANKSLELIGKHINIQAWKEKQEVTVSGSVTPWNSIKAGVASKDGNS